MTAREAISDVKAGIAQADDARVTRIVAMVDSMPNRGEADALIAPLRHRLSHLRPVRPIGLLRLVFTPLDTVLVPAPHWRRGDPGVPRSAIGPLGPALLAALPSCTGPVTLARVAELGATAWPLAAVALDAMAMPANWPEQSGLALGDFPGLINAMATILADAVAIDRLATSRRAPADDAIRAVLSRANRRGGAATTVAVLLARLPSATQVMMLAAELGGDAAQRPADYVIDHTLARLQTATADDEVSLAEAAAEASRIAALVAGLEENASSDRRRRLDQLRREAGALALGRFDRSAHTMLSHTAGVVGGTLDDDAVIGMESAARDLRRLETAGRRLGNAERYDAMLRTMSDGVRTGPCGLGFADRVRLVEILSGPDDALALLASAPA